MNRLHLALLIFLFGIIFFDTQHCIIVKGQSKLRIHIENQNKNPDRKDKKDNDDIAGEGGKFDWNTIKTSSSATPVSTQLKNSKTLRDIKLPNKLKTRKYINGYEDKTFRAEQNIMRAEVAQALYKLINDGEKINYDALKKFSDVESNKWYSEAIAYIAKKQIVNGSDDGKYNPNKPITRAETAQILYNMLKSYDIGEKVYKYGSNIYDLKDIDGAWYTETIKQLASNRMVDGVGDELFKPNDNITRAQFVAMIAKTFGRNISKTTAASRLKDMKTNHWAVKYINNAAE